ncbi:hypothetical protein, partial [Shigella sonnei]
GGTADRNRSHWSTSKTPSYTKSVSWQHHQAREYSRFFLLFNKYKYILIMRPAAGHYFSISGYLKFCCFIREYLYDT